MLKAFLISSLLLSSSFVSAADWYGFCYGKKSGKVLCSPIEKKTPDFSTHCKNWAMSQAASVWGNHTGTSTVQLKKKQDIKCDMMITPTPVPGSPMSTYDCLAIQTCPAADGMSSSQSANILGTVSAMSRPEAISACISTYASDYLVSLEEASKVPLCHFIADAAKQ